ncbi:MULTISPECIES: siderophore ABC transporter substrate-binding protein [Paenibacillus]|uniref:Putative ABC transporter solute-binding protein n=1 Tax=Paenibacillus naphthalenovorans TaxID=162209 RepID=A0A0U2KX84_9BACL|nr:MULTISPECIES: siderophore ABC transporter substrate-binding protein [Paenibacillus]ALS21394.1 putative ABC transporter solute-binding protein [Paenibacillus naphthalenovorans]
MSKKLSLIFLTVLLAVVFTACGTTGGGTTDTAANLSNGSSDGAPAPKVDEELTIKHQLGETKVKKNPQKVVVFDFGTLDTLDKLGVQVTGVPQANIPPYLSKYQDAKYVNVGSLKEPDFEKINQIGPDLIIISGRQSEAYQELSKIGPTIFVGVDNAKYMESFKQNMTLLGSIFDKASAVEEELAKIDATINNVKEKATASGKNGLIVLVTGGKVSAYGPGSRFGLIHDVLGFAPVEKNIEVSTHGQSISFEFIVEKNPDYLFVIDRDAAVGNESPAKQVIENELVKKTKAYQNGTIVYLDPNYWYLSGGGLISVAEMAKEVEAGLK